MRLVSCYIENFGGLSRFSMDFAPGLTVVQQPNGFGKTTLAEFIRAMFYGFPRKTRNQLGRRQKYCPWNGGKYGGHLTFEHEGKQYRIERTFGTTPRGDTFNLIDLQTGRKSSRFPEEVGQALFGLDADSFERSTYLPQSRETGPLTTDSIRAKLSDLVEDTGDVGNFEKAVQTLRTKRSSYVPYRGQGGAVAEDQARITRIQQALDGARENEQALAGSAGELQRLQAEQVRVTGEIDSLRRDLTAANEAAARLAHHQHHDRLTAALAQAEAEQNALAGKYPRGMPRQEALDPVSDAVDQAARLAALQPVTAEDQKAQRLVEAHGSRFAEGVPDGAEFDRLRRTWDDRRKAEARLDACTLPEGENAELRALESFFAPGIPEEEVLSRCEKDLEEAERLRRENLRLAAQTVETVPCKVPSPLTMPLLLGCGGAAMLTGIVLLVRGHYAPGGAALTLGVLALLGAVWVNLRRTMTRQVTALSPQLQALILENEERAAALEAAARSFSKIYGNAEPAEIRRRVRRLEELQARQQAMAGSRWELNALVAEYDAALDGFFEKYHYRPEGDAYDGLNRFQRICENWDRAQQQLRDRDERLEQHRRETAQIQDVLEAFREKYGAVPRNRAQVLTLRDDIRRSGELADTIKKLKQQLADYRREHAEALAAPVPDAADPAALRRREAMLLERHSRISGELLRLEQQVRQLRESVDRIPELQDELSRWQEKKKEDQSSAAVLDDTLDFLSRARENLSTAYMGSIRQSFAGLMTRMAGEQAERILVTPELEVHLEREGQSRPLAYFSAGQTDLTMLCMRLALVDALFREARPFVILDDPFVNLDDGHTREALALLKDLSRDRQIIYLTCHSSRR